MSELEKLINENKKLIYSISHYFEKYPNKEDLFQVGCIGLIEASKKYDPNLGAKFSTYAYPFILGQMKKYVREDRKIKVSRDITKLNLKIEKANIILSQKLMRMPTTLELSNFLEIPVSLIDDALSTTTNVASLDKQEDDLYSLYETIPSKETVDRDDLIELKNQINKLSDEERQLINYRYVNDYTQNETAKKLSISQVQVSRYEQKVLKKLKANMA